MAVHSDGSRNTSEEMESGRESGSCGWRHGNIRKVYLQSSQFWVGLEEKLWEDLELVPVQTTVERKRRKKRHLRISRTTALVPVRFVLLCGLSHQQTGHSVSSEVSRSRGQRPGSWESPPGSLPSCDLQVIMLCFLFVWVQLITLAALWNQPALLSLHGIPPGDHVWDLNVLL